ncbi:MAG: DUF4435 domain-containing protein [Paracoccaceae bacterium]|nr:DUF4435 domain-containing protein [Paracoccaceae bacterium]MDE2917461.1 DUF4435 domain-containing protein [Paracoccaceae bacterium]
MNTVSQEICGSNIAADIRQQRQVDSRCVLLVEGTSDDILFKKFVQDEKCRIHICHSKQNLLDAITDLDKDGVPGVIGICDKDFSDILGFPAKKDSILFTDENDIEIMIISSTVFHSLLMEYGKDERVKALETTVGKPIREQIFEAASFIGVLRLISSREKLNLKFRDMDYKFVKKNGSFNLDKLQTVKYILNRSKKSGIKICDLLALMEEELAKCEDRSKICNGHDCVRHLGRAFYKSIGNISTFNGERGAELLASILRASYGYGQFSQTNLYETLRSWEDKTGYQVLRKNI